MKRSIVPASGLDEATPAEPNPHFRSHPAGAAASALAKAAPSSSFEDHAGAYLLAETGLRRLLTIEHVAEFLSVSPKTVRRLIARRGLPHIRFGRMLRFDRGDVFRWLQARKEG